MRLVADLHIHTYASGHAYSTIEECAQVAQRQGLAMIAVTDHGPQMPGGPHPYYFGNLRVLPPLIHGVRVLRGVEANIINRQGHLDLDDFYLDRLDLVLAGLHNPTFQAGTVAENTQALIKAMENPYVDVIVHPGNPEFTVNYPELAQASRELGVALEINNSSFTGSRKGSHPNCTTMAREVARLGGLVSVGSDAHFSMYIGEFDEALKTITEAGIAPEQVLNTSEEKLNNFLLERNKHRPRTRGTPPF